MNCKLPSLVKETLPLHMSPTHNQWEKTTLPRLRAGLVAAVLLGLFPSDPLVAQEPRRSSYARVSNPVAAESQERRGEEEGAKLPLPAEKDGNKLVADAARQVFRLKALEAKVRQRVSVFGQEVPGAGEYAQLSLGQQKLLRLEMKMQIGKMKLQKLMYLINFSAN